MEEVMLISDYYSFNLYFASKALWGSQAISSTTVVFARELLTHYLRMLYNFDVQTVLHAQHIIFVQGLKMAIANNIIINI
jgi:phosphatidylglycerophosphate synthase